MYSSTLNSIKTGSDITGSGRISVDENLLVGGRGSGTITGYSDGVLTTTSGKAGCVIAPDGAIIIVCPWSGFKSTLDFSGKDYVVCLGTGASEDSTVTMQGTYDSSSNTYTVVITRGAKVYTIAIDATNNTLTLVSYVNNAQ